MARKYRLLQLNDLVETNVGVVTGLYIGKDRNRTIRTSTTVQYVW